METKNKNTLFFIHVVVTLFLMFGFGFLPPIGSITPLGMKLIGIFLGLIYAWSTTSMIWPSLVGMVAILLTGVVDLKTLLADGFGNNTVVFILMVFIFAAAIEGTGLTNYLAHYLMNLKWTKGHPWRIVFVILLGSYVISAMTSLYPVVLIFWTIIYKICEVTGYKAYDKFPTLMIIGIMLCATLGTACLPFKPLAMVLNGAYESFTGDTIGFLSWMEFSIPVGIFGLIVYMLLMRFFFRLDLKKMAQESESEYLEVIDITKAQKLSLVMLISFIVLASLPALISKTVIGQALMMIGSQGILMVILAIMILIKVDGTPLLDFKKAAKDGILWDVIIMFVVVFPLSSYITSDGTGVQEFLSMSLGPIFKNLSPLVFSILILAVATFITNFANNTVVALIFLSILIPMSEIVGVNPLPIAAGMAICTQFAFLTPAASAPAAILYGNTGWVRTKDIYKYMSISILVLTFVTIILTVTLGNKVF